ncbi:hypothetical protein P43SY_011873 [Pythium insidiosum]|uniref:Uncharacterized protein n=1 Tax=Pythium insidiosum TaxID=114742 RepID=A0AAD5LS33_PYTIN|nr:hypothetical protein P43SY_011873 [Pythium insidiosum]
MGSPVKRVKQAIRVRSMKNDVVLSSVEAFRKHVAEESISTGGIANNVVVTGTLIWKSEHKYGDRQLVRLHITDAHPEDSFEELSEELYNSNDENRSLVDSELITAAVFGETADSPRLPQNGEVIRIANSRKRLVYDGNKCQLVARAADITTL